MRIETFFPYQLAVVAEAFSRQLVEVHGREHGLSREGWRLLFLLKDAGSLDSLQISQRTSPGQGAGQSCRIAAGGEGPDHPPDPDQRPEAETIRHHPAGQDLFQQAFAGVAARADEILALMTEADRMALQQRIAALGRVVSTNRAEKGDPAG